MFSSKPLFKFLAFHRAKIRHSHNSVMRQGQFELLLMTEDGRAMEEHTFDGKPTARAEPDTTYHVRVNMYKDENGNYPAAGHLRYYLFVDGKDVQYCTTVKVSAGAVEPVSRNFWGFRKNDTEVLAFKFAPTIISTDASAASAEMEQKLGSVRPLVCRVEYAGDETAPRSNFQYQESPDTQNINGSKKFWKQPSVTTVGGTAMPGKLAIAAMERKVTSKKHVAALELQYHSGDIVDILDRIHSSRKLLTSSASKRKSAVPEVVDLTDETPDSATAPAPSPVVVDLNTPASSAPPAVQDLTSGDAPSATALGKRAHLPMVSP
jgi:hypothetical protein